MKIRGTMITGLILLASSVFPSPTLAQEKKEPPRVLERVDDPYVAPGPQRLTRPPAERLGGLPGPGVQVNVTDGGFNVAGDAANEPSIAVDPTAPNRIAIGWRQFDTITSNFRQAGYSYSNDGGRTWAPMNIIEPGIFRSDPVLEAAPDGTFYYLSLSVVGGDFLCDMFISSDGGMTWPSKNFAFGGDKSWFTIDRTTGVGAGNMYQAWNTAGNLFFPNQFNRSTDGGVTWEDPVQYDPGGNPPARPVFGILDVGPDGAVYVAGSRNSSNTSTFWVVKSVNAQFPGVPISFDQIVQVDLGGNLRIGTGPNPAGLLGQINIATDHSGGPTHGNVYVLGSVEVPPLDPMDIHLIRSSDGGQTWSPPTRINSDAFDNGAWQWFGTMSVAPNGRIDVVWNDTRNSGGDPAISELFYSFSADGGVNWSPEVPLSAPFNSHVGWPQQNKLGDYYDMISDNVGAHLAWAATFNGEQDVYYLRIGDYDCNGNGIGDTDDLAAGTSQDCNANGIPDECEIAAGAVADDNGNGVPDTCEGSADINGDGVVDVLDLLIVLAAWGPCDPPCPPACPADLNGDCGVDVLDLLALLANWS